MLDIRSASAIDKNAIEKLYAVTTGTSLSLSDEEWYRWIDLQGVVIAELANQVIGFGGIDVTAREQLRWLYLLPEHQGAGFGSRILQELEQIAWRNGLQSIRLHSTPGAVQFYAKLGYTRVPTHEQFGHDHDGVEMVKFRPDVVS